MPRAVLIVTVGVIAATMIQPAGVAVAQSASITGIVVNVSGQPIPGVTVTAEDALRVTAGAYQGEFRPGTTVTMWLQGYYSVDSAETGRLRVRITDQAGTITTTAPLTVSKAGALFLLSSTFVVPQRSAEVCRTAVLEVGSVTIAEPRSNESGLWCLSIRQGPWQLVRVRLVVRPAEPRRSVARAICDGDGD